MKGKKIVLTNALLQASVTEDNWASLVFADGLHISTGFWMIFPGVAPVRFCSRRIQAAYEEGPFELASNVIGPKPRLFLRAHRRRIRRLRKLKYWRAQMESSDVTPPNPRCMPGDCADLVHRYRNGDRLIRTVQRRFLEMFEQAGPVTYWIHPIHEEILVRLDGRILGVLMPIRA